MTVDCITGVLHDLQLNQVSKELVERTCSLEFTENPEFDLVFQEDANTAFAQLIRAVVHVQCKYERDGQTVWAIFDDQGVSCKQLQVWVYYLLHRGLSKSSTFCDKERALFSADLCFLLLKERGDQSYQFFHEIIFEKSVNALKMAAQANSSEPKRKKHSQKPSQKRARAQGMPLSCEADTDDEDEGDAVILNSQQAVALVHHLLNALQDFCHLLQIFSLKDRPALIKHSVESLVFVAKQFGEASFTTIDREISELVLPDQVALKALKLLVNQKHGDPNKLALLVLRLLMTTVTMRYAVSTSGNVPRIFVKRSEAAVVLMHSIYGEHEEKVESALKAMMQNLIAQCPDRSEMKSHVSGIVSTFIYKMPILWFANFVDWLIRFAQHTKISYRVGSLFVIGQLLNQPERSFADDVEASDSLKTSVTHKHLLQTVMNATTDFAPTVRSRALAVLCDVMNKQVVAPAVFAELIQGPDAAASPEKENTNPTPITGVTPMDPDVRKSSWPPLVTPTTLRSVQAPSRYLFPHNAVNNLLTLLENRCSEEKVAVRRNAVQTLEVALCKGVIAATKRSITIMKKRCRDPMLSVRKLAIQGMTSVLLAYSDSEEIQRRWMKSVLPSIQDHETSIQEKSAQLIEEIILNGVLDSSAKEALAWSLLAFLGTDKGDKFRIYMQRVVKLWNQQQKLTKAVLRKIAQHLEDDAKKTCAWILMRMVSLFLIDTATASCVVSGWGREEDVDNVLSLRMDIISCLGQVARKMNDADKDYALAKLKKEVETYTCSIQLISFYFEAIQRIFDSQHEDAMTAKQPMDDWCAHLLDSSTAWLSDVVLTSSSTSCDEDLLVKHLHTVGDAAQRSPKNVPKRLLLATQALLTNPGSGDDANPPSQGLSQPLSQFHSTGVSPRVRAHCIINLGRICFQNEKLAKKVVPAMARELETCQEESVRNNVLVVLTDLCLLQTQLVDPYLAEMGTCLGDESALIRKHSVILISSLLRKEYVKWRGTLLFKFLHTVCDEDKKIRSLARYCLLDQILKGATMAGDLFFRNFVACIFYFNDYNEHNAHKFAKSEREKLLFSVAGSDGFEKRMKIYKFLLESMEDEHRINLTGKLCTDILESFVEATIPLNKSTRHLLTDTLAVLCCKEIRLKCLKSKDAESEIEEEVMGSQAERNAAANAMQAKVKQKIISQVVKRNLVENIIPIIIALKSMLSELKSPLVHNVMLYLKEVMQEYRAEVQFILSADKQLATEIEFDLKRFEREQEELKVQEMLQSAPNSRKNSVVESPAPPGSPATPRASTTTPETPLAAVVAAATPATARRRNRPMNVQAILNSARKNLHSNGVSSPKPNPPTFVPSTPAVQSISIDERILRAASTPSHFDDQNITFAKDISAIVTTPRVARFEEAKGGRHNLVLLPHPEKLAPATTWNVTSPSPRKSSRSRIARKSDSSK